MTVTCRCGARFSTQVRNGLKQHRKCSQCRRADKPIKAPRWLRRKLIGLARADAKAVSRRFGGTSHQPSRGRLSGLKRLSRAKSSIRPKKLWLKVDRTLTEAMNFRDKESKAMLDGRLILEGQDMSLMRHLVLERDGFRCVRCPSQRDLQVHHIRHKGNSPRDDRPMNLETLCAPCHRLEHPNQQVKFSKKERECQTIVTAAI